MSRDFLEVKISDGSVRTGQAPAGSSLPFPWDDSSGMPEAVPALLLTRYCSEEHLFSSSCFPAGFRQGRKRELADGGAEQARGGGCGKPRTTGSPGRRGEGGPWRCSWQSEWTGQLHSASDRGDTGLAVKTDTSRERGEFWNYKGEHKPEGKDTAMKAVGLRWVPRYMCGRGNSEIEYSCIGRHKSTKDKNISWMTCMALQELRSWTSLCILD